MPQFGLDYGFYSDDLKREEKRKPGCVVVAIMKEKKTTARYAHVVTTKGGEDGYAAKSLAEDIDEMGCKRVILKTDQERAVEALAARVAEHRKGETIPGVSPKGSPASNGLAECGVKEISGHARTIKLALESVLQCKIPIDHNIILWIFEAASQQLNRYQVNARGRTAYEEIKGNHLT